MSNLNPAAIFDDFKSGKMDKSSFIEIIQEENSSHIILNLYQFLEEDGSEDGVLLKSIMEETLGKEFLIYFDIVDPKEGMALKLLQLDTGYSPTTDSGSSQHYIQFKSEKGHVVVLLVCQVVVPTTKFLRFLPHLRVLSFYSQCINKIEGLEHLKELKKLELTDNGLEEIPGLENLIHLEDLDVSYNQLTEIIGLENLTKLRKLDLSYNQLKEICNLRNLKNLEELHLIENKIDKIEGLKNLTNLRVLDA
jgi:hypothetical protein